MEASEVKRRASEQGIPVAEARRQLDYEELLQSVVRANTKAELQGVLYDLVVRLHDKGVV